MVAYLRANPVRRLMPRPGVIDRDPSRGLQAGPQNLEASGREPLLAPVEKPDNLGEISTPIAQQVTKRGNGNLATVIPGQGRSARSSGPMRGR